MGGRAELASRAGQTGLEMKGEKGTMSKMTELEVRDSKILRY